MGVFFQPKEAIMQVSVKAVLLCAAAIVAAASVVPARADGAKTHIMTIQLPNGAVERIRYTGDVAPQVVPAPAPVAFAMPGFMPASAMAEFAALQRMSDAMDAQEAVMLRQAAELPRLTQAGFANLPAGATGYSMVSTFSSNGACTRTTQVTYRGDGLAPQTVSNVSGDCAAPGAAPVRAVPARAHHQPDLANRTVLADASRVSSGVREVAWAQQ